MSFSSDYITTVYIGQDRYRVYLDDESAKDFDTNDKDTVQELANRLHAHILPLLVAQSYNAPKEITVTKEKTTVDGQSHRHQDTILSEQIPKIRENFHGSSFYEWTQNIPLGMYKEDQLKGKGSPTRYTLQLTADKIFQLMIVPKKKEEEEESEEASTDKPSVHLSSVKTHETDQAISDQLDQLFV